MKAAEFRILLGRLGERYIANLGFEFRNGNWFYHDGRFHLGLLACAGRWENGFRVKRMTLAMAHSDVKTVDGMSPAPFDDDLYHYAIHIAPSLLAPLIESGFDLDVWRYSFIANRSSSKLWSTPIFYGGFGLPILKDKQAARKAHDKAWQELLAENDVDYISDGEAARRLETVFAQTGENCMKWAAWCTHSKVVSLLGDFGSKPPLWFEQKLLNNYAERNA